MEDGGPYKGADSVHWPFIYISNEESSIYKKESDTRLHTVAIHWLDVVWFLRFFPNLMIGERPANMWVQKADGGP